MSTTNYPDASGSGINLDGVLGRAEALPPTDSVIVGQFLTDLGGETTLHVLPTEHGGFLDARGEAVTLPLVSWTLATAQGASDFYDARDEIAAERRAALPDCQHCNGSGWLREIYEGSGAYREEPCAEHYDGQRFPCDECGGTGKAAP